MTTESELEDFEQCIIEADLYVSDFKLTEQRDAPGDIQHMGTGTVTVTYTPPTSAARRSTPTGISRTYRAGVVPTWPVEFERELKLNIFKTR